MHTSVIYPVIYLLITIISNVHANDMFIKTGKVNISPDFICSNNTKQLILIYEDNTTLSFDLKAVYIPASVGKISWFIGSLSSNFSTTGVTARFLCNSNSSVTGGILSASNAYDLA